jgi:hypothetical protein
LRTAAILIFIVVGYAAVLHKFGVQGYYRFIKAPTSPDAADSAIKQLFLGAGQSDEQRYEALFGYFLTSTLAATDQAGSRVHYAGAPSMAGYKVGGMEGFVRTGTLLAAWVASGRDPVFVDKSSGTRTDLVDYLRHGLLVGTDPASRGYWGRIRSGDQRIVEAADVARIVWMTREQIWQKLEPAQQTRIAAWLRQVDGADTPANVWLLFTVTVDRVLHSLGQPGFPAYAQSQYAKFKQNYLSNGWFNDPPEGVDFYGAWGYDYELFWIDQVDPQFDHEYIHGILRDAAELDAHLISPAGIPIMGRSICYRTAVPVPLIAAVLAGETTTTTAGLARRGLDATWRYFVANGALQGGGLTQGYFGTDLRFLDLYSGPGSCAWGQRSLLLALLNKQNSDFWAVPQQPLPVEQADYRLDYEKLGWTISGSKADGEITIEIPKNRDKPQPVPVPYSLWRHLLEPLLCRPFRPQNEAVGYERARYSALHPYVLEGETGHE